MHVALLKFFVTWELNLPILNVGTKQEISIKKLSKLIAKYINFNVKYKNLEKILKTNIKWFKKIY